MAALSPTGQRQHTETTKTYRLLAQPTAGPYVEGFAAPGIEGSKFFFENLVRYLMASSVVLAEQGLVPKARARREVGAYGELLRRGVDALPIDPGLEDLHPNVEKAVIALIGIEDAGDVSIGRARAEFGHVAAHLALRDETLATIVELLRVNRRLLDIAARHVDTIVPYYTQHMRAEPITFGYYFSAFSEAFTQNVERIRDAYGRYGRSPAGVGHIVPTPLPIDRKRLAKMIGLDDVVHHSLYAYLNSDVFVESLAGASVAAASFSRLCLDFWWWASNELEIIRFGDAWCGGSFIMPHKRNPSWLKALRFSAMAVKARHDEAQELWMHGAPMFLVGSLPIPGLTHEGLKSLRYCCDLLYGSLQDLSIDAAKARAVAEKDFVQSSQLVSLLVANKQASWRRAELVIGRFVKEALDAGQPASSLSFDRLLEVGREVLGRDLELDRAAFQKALDVAQIVESRADCGPAPKAVGEAIERQRGIVAELERWARGEQQRISDNWKRVEQLAAQI